MNFDVRTLFLIAIPIGFAFSILQAAHWLRWRDPASLWWAATDGLGTAGAVLLLSNQWLPAWIARSLAQTAIFASGLLMWLGFRRFAGQPLPLRIFAVVSLVYFGAFEALRSFVNDLAPLIVLSSFGHGMQHAGIALDLARAPQFDHRRLRAVLVTVFVLQALFYLFRSATAVTVDSDAVFLNTTGLQSATLLIAILGVVLWNVAALWMMNDRYRSRSAAAAKA